MNARGKVASVLCTAALVAAVPAWAHHSFSIFDAEQTKTFTGVVTRVNPDANHLQIFFAPMNDQRNGVERNAEGKPIVWAVEMAGSAQSAKDGISVNSFPPGTIFSVSLHPLRNGDPAGARAGALYKCPDRTPPGVGKNCDSVTGNVAIGGEVPPPTQNYDKK